MTDPNAPPDPLGEAAAAAVSERVQTFEGLRVRALELRCRRQARVFTVALVVLGLVCTAALVHSLWQARVAEQREALQEERLAQWKTAVGFRFDDTSRKIEQGNMNKLRSYDEISRLTYQVEERLPKAITELERSVRNLELLVSRLVEKLGLKLN